MNVLGNFDTNPDPIRRDNIMFSAFLGDVINSFEAATGSTVFDEPGSLTFVWSDGRTFAYDHHSIYEAVKANFERSRLGFFPCEPGWSFTVCNVMGAQALHGHDVAHGTDGWQQVRDRWQQTLDHEYLTPDGSYAHIRSNHVGLSWDTGEVPGGHYFANGTHRFVDILPAHARRAKALDLRGARPKMAALSAMVTDDRLPLDLPAEPERHRTRHQQAAAVDQGDRRCANGGRRAVGRCRHPHVGRTLQHRRRWPERPLDVGAAGLGSYMLLRWSSPLDLAALNMRGYQQPAGPILDDTAWDDVLVTEARSPDGVSLLLHLRPRRGEVHGVRLRFVALHPWAGYRLLGAGPAVSVVADGSGHADVVLPVEGPLELILEPVDRTVGHAS